MLKIIIPQNKEQLKKQIRGLENLIENDTTEKDRKIHQNIDVVKSQIAGKPLNFFNKNCRAYNDYYSLTMEVINKWVQRKQI